MVPDPVPDPSIQCRIRYWISHPIRCCIRYWNRYRTWGSSTGSSTGLGTGSGPVLDPLTDPDLLTDSDQGQDQEQDSCGWLSGGLGVVDPRDPQGPWGSVCFRSEDPVEKWFACSTNLASFRFCLARLAPCNRIAPTVFALFCLCFCFVFALLGWRSAIE